MSNKVKVKTLRVKSREWTKVPSTIHLVSIERVVKGTKPQAVRFEHIPGQLRVKHGSKGDEVDVQIVYLRPQKPTPLPEGTMWPFPLPTNRSDGPKGLPGTY
jgi:hypothetical protein